ncbi:hypothetical protein BDY19DRAFT_650220 [Irpex rosettiformis]|uniref:Uncharacterized protein n=1 Tax=Irpex rosettiformis TaxID=378272 RepID=A0ACB8TNN4_9APHY|nr:hypothetical protein BDY19DRAFT_650220 [Irpex rosettiformis]
MGPLSRQAISDWRQDTNQMPTPPGEKFLLVDNATRILELNGLHFMTALNFLHQAGRVHLGPGVPALEAGGTGLLSTTNIASPWALSVRREDSPPLLLCFCVHSSYLSTGSPPRRVRLARRKDPPIISTPHGRKNMGPRGHTDLFLMHAKENIHKSNERPGIEIINTGKAYFAFLFRI